MCASPLGGAAVPVGTAEYSLRLSAFRFRLFLSFLPVRSCPFVLFVIHAEAALANASTGICPLPLGMEHRMKSVKTISVSGLPSLGRKDAPRE
jgi:hypothetical protein